MEHVYSQQAGTIYVEPVSTLPSAISSARFGHSYWAHRKSFFPPSNPRRRLLLLALILVALQLLWFLPQAECRGRELPVGATVNLNNATVDELMQLPGIGKKRAEAILELRGKHPFRRKEEIMRVRGIGWKMYKRFQEFLSVGAVATMEAPAPPTSSTAPKPRAVTPCLPGPARGPETPSALAQKTTE